MKNKLRWLLSVALMLALLTGFTVTAHAAGNDTATATKISLGSTYKGTISEDNTIDVYKFSISSSGKVTLDVTAYIGCSHYYIWDANGSEVVSWTEQWWNENSQTMKLNSTVDLTKGTYYFVVERYSHTRRGTYYGNYNFKITFKSASESFAEPQGGNNNTMATADTVSLAKTYKGQIAKNDHIDVYKFKMPSSGKLTLAVTAYINCSNYYIWDDDGNVMASWGEQWWNDNSQTMKLNNTIDLTKGTYYLVVERYSHTRRGTYYGNYNFKLTFKSASESFAEPQGGNNNTMATADKISLGKTYKGQIALNDHIDVYKFTVPATCKFTLKVTAAIQCSNYYIWNVDGNAVASWDEQWWQDDAKKLKLNSTVELTKGTYYLVVERYSHTRRGTYYGNYSFSINCNHQYKTTATTKATLSKNGSVTKKCSVCGQTTKTTIKYAKSFKLSATSYTYNGKVKHPSVTVRDTSGKALKKGTDYTVSYSSGCKNVGTYKAVVKMKGNYSGTKTLTFKINPVKISKCKVSLAATSYICDGKVKTPAVTVKNASGKVLKKGTDYTVTYASGRKNAGTYKVTVKMKGNYSGSKALTFKIQLDKTSKVTLVSKKTNLSAGWKAVKGASGYKVVLKSVSSGSTVKTVMTSSTKASFTNLKKGTKYKVVVTAYKTVNGKKVYANASNSATAAIAPVAPKVKASSAWEIVDVNWGKVSGASGYEVYMATSKGGTYSKVSTTTSTSYSDWWLTAGKTYYFKVRAYTSVGSKKVYGEFSTPVKVKCVW